MLYRTAITALLFVAFLPVAHAQAAPSVPIELAPALKPFVESHSLAGAVVLVANKDKVLDLEAVGYSDVASKTPMKTDAVFWIASQSKPITAAALMILVDEGKVKLDDPVAKYLPEFRDLWVATERDNDHILLKRPSRPITVREILSHTSGMPFASAMEQPTLDGLSLRDAVKSYAMTPLQSEPGTKYQYSNAGINTAGRIIEVVGGMPYEDFLQKRLFDPLGMKDTTFWPDDAQLKRLAKSYKPNSAKNDLEETTVGQLQYPLNDRKRRYPDAGRRPVLDGRGRVAVLPHAARRGRVRGEAHPLRIGRQGDGEQADRPIDQGRLRPGPVRQRRHVRPRRGVRHEHEHRR